MSEDLNFSNFKETAHNADFSGSANDRLTDILDHTRTNLLRTQRRIERSERQYESLLHHVQALWLFVGVVVIGGAVLSWYEFTTISRQAQSLTGQSLFQEAKAESRSPVAPPVPAQIPIPAQIPTPPVPDTSQNAIASANTNRPVETETRKTAADISKIPRLSDGIRRQRVDFEISNNKTEQISPGLYLTINGTNVRQQAVDGWLQIASDGHTVLIMKQEAEKVLIFGKKKDPRPIALVFTHVEPDRVSGYLMVPQTEAG